MALTPAAEPYWPLHVLRVLMNTVRLNHRGDDRRTLLWHASANSNKWAVEALITAGADVNVKDRYGRSPLWANSESGSPDIAEALITAGAVLDEGDLMDGSTPLLIAVYARQERVARALVAAGADVNAADSDGKTPLWFAMDTKASDELVDALIDGGAHGGDLF